MGMPVPRGYENSTLGLHVRMVYPQLDADLALGVGRGQAIIQRNESRISA